MDAAVAAARSVVESFEYVKEGMYHVEGAQSSSDEEEEEVALPTLREAYRAMWKKTTPRKRKKNTTSWKLPIASMQCKDFELPADVYLDAASTMRAERFRERKTRTLEVAMNEFEPIKKNVSLTESKRTDEEYSACGCDESTRCADASSCSSRAVLVECTSSTCALGRSCENRRLQRPTYNRKLKVAPAGRKGFGLFAAETFDAGDLVGEYLGEVMSTERYRQLSKTRIGEKHTYFMRLGTDDVIDASRKAGLCRFLNHSCQPNCEAELWTVNGEKRVAIVATQPVSPSEEFTFDYDWADGNGKCFCGAPNCRGALGKNHQMQRGRGRRARTAVFSSDDEDDSDDESVAHHDNSESFRAMIQSWYDEASLEEEEENLSDSAVSRTDEPIEDGLGEEKANSSEDDEDVGERESDENVSPEDEAFLAEEESEAKEEVAPSDSLDSAEYEDEEKAESIVLEEDDQVVDDIFSEESASPMREVDAPTMLIARKTQARNIKVAESLAVKAESLPKVPSKIAESLAMKVENTPKVPSKVVESFTVKAESLPKVPSKVTVDASKRRAAYLERVAQLNAIKEPADPRGRRVVPIPAMIAKKSDPQQDPQPPPAKRDVSLKRRRSSYDTSDSEEDEEDEMRRSRSFRQHYRWEDRRRRRYDSPPRGDRWGNRNRSRSRDRSPRNGRRSPPPRPRSTFPSSRMRPTSPPRSPRRFSNFSSKPQRRQSEDLPAYKPVSGVERKGKF